MQKKLDLILGWFYQPVAPQIAALFRIVVGLCAVGSISLFAPYLKELFSNEGYISSAQALTLRSMGGGGTGTSLFFLNDNLMFVQGVYLVTFVSAVLYTIGVWPQFFAFATWIGYMSFYNRNPTIGYGGSEIIFMLLFFSIFLKSNHTFSLCLPRNPSKSIPGWPLRLVQINFAIIYLFAAITKLQGRSWQNGTELLGVISSQYGILNYYWLSEYPFVVALMTYSSTFFELAAVYLIWFEATRRFSMFCILLLNLGILVTINVTFFPLVMIASLIAFAKIEDIYFIQMLYKEMMSRVRTNILNWKKIAFVFLLIGAITGGVTIIHSKLISYFDNNCPKHYIPIQGSPLRSTTNFCVMQYEAKQYHGKAISYPYGIPWTNINYYDAHQACLANGAGYSLLSDNQWLTIADNIAQVAINNFNTFETPLFPQGNSTGTGTALGAKFIDTPFIWGCDLSKSLLNKSNAFQSYYCEFRGVSTSLGCKGYCGSSGTFNPPLKDKKEFLLKRLQLRTLVTSSGDIIWDLPGNVWEWTLHDFLLEKKTGDGKNFYEDSNGFDGSLPIPQKARLTTGYHEYTKITDWKNLNHIRPLYPHWHSQHGIGMIYLNPGDSWGANTEEEKTQKAFIRGGAWGNPNSAGIYALNLSHSPVNTASYIGFRCAFQRQ